MRFEIIGEDEGVFIQATFEHSGKLQGLHMLVDESHTILNVRREMIKAIEQIMQMSEADMNKQMLALAK